MNDEEAIEIIQHNTNVGYGIVIEGSTEKINQALDRAIKSLENRPQAITNDDIKCAIDEGFKNGYEMAKAKFERPKGNWLTHQTGFLLWEECNQCTAQVGTIGMNFCPNCGADMRETENEDSN